MRATLLYLPKSMARMALVDAVLRVVFMLHAFRGGVGVCLRGNLTTEVSIDSFGGRSQGHGHETRYRSSVGAGDGPVGACGRDQRPGQVAHPGGAVPSAAQGIRPNA